MVRMVLLVAIALGLIAAGCAIIASGPSGTMLWVGLGCLALGAAMFLSAAKRSTGKHR